MLSKVTPNDEIGAIFSLLASLEAASPLVVSPLVTYVYDHTIHLFPGTFMFLYAGFYILAIITFCIIYILSKRSFHTIENLYIIENEESTHSESSENE